jgi:hypothetical protein
VAARIVEPSACAACSSLNRAWTSLEPLLLAVSSLLVLSLKTRLPKRASRRRADLFVCGNAISVMSRVVLTTLRGGLCCCKMETRRILCGRPSLIGVQIEVSKKALSSDRSATYPTSSMTPTFTEEAGRPSFWRYEAKLSRKALAAA